MDNLKQQAISSLKWLAIFRWTTQILSWMSTIVVARFLAPTDYGALGLTITFVGFFELSNELGMGVAIVQKDKINNKQLSSVFFGSLFVSLLLYIVAFITSKYISQFYDIKVLSDLIKVLAINLLVWVFGFIPENLLVRELQFKLKSLLEAIARTIQIIITLLMAINGYGVWSIVIGQCAYRISYTIFLLCKNFWFPKLHFTFSELKNYIDFGLAVVAGRYLWYFYSKADYLIAGKFLSEKLLGIYTMAMILSSMPVDRISGLINQVSYPLFSKLQNDKKKIRNAFITIIESYSIIIFPFFIGLIIICDKIIPLLIGMKWEAVIQPLQILAIVGAMRCIGVLGPPILWAVGKPIIETVNTLIFAIVLPIAFYVGVHYGVMGLAISWLIAFPILNLITTYRCIKPVNLGILKYMKALKTAFVASCILYVNGFLLGYLYKIILVYYDHIYIYDYIYIAIQIIMGAAIYTLFVFFFDRNAFYKVKQIVFKRKVETA